MKQEDLKNAPKLFCENIRVGFSPEYFVVGLSSGSQSNIYALTPEHAKRLHEYLEHEIKNFEEKHHKIEAKWDPNVLSPVQRANPPSEGS
ncbi:hypothetical protein KC845_00650 [Candidatus Kaiserbacteria bacterium]|nr:hypothetical protein [Candidatus Kaiserbacteria bacterium]